MTARNYLLGSAAAFTLLLAGCDSVRTPGAEAPAETDVAETSETAVVDEAALAENPLLQDWDTPYGVPPFAELDNEDYLPAINFAIAELEA
ncbi:MAG: M3 family peptidase, partial [Pseudomonadota bacterium]